MFKNTFSGELGEDGSEETKLSSTEFQNGWGLSKARTPYNLGEHPRNPNSVVLHQVQGLPQAKKFFNLACSIANYTSRTAYALHPSTHVEKEGRRENVELEGINPVILYIGWLEPGDKGLARWPTVLGQNATCPWSIAPALSCWLLQYKA